MVRRTIALDIATGVAGGLVATWLSDHVQDVLLKCTPDSELEREPDTKDGSSAKSAARALLEQTETVPTEARLETTKVCIHYGLGVSWGTLYWLLRRGARLTPVGAGLASGAALSLVVDETLSPLLGITPPNHTFPASSHVRGFVTHLFWGLAAAATAETLHRSMLRKRDARHVEKTGKHKLSTRHEQISVNPPAARRIHAPAPPG